MLCRGRGPRTPAVLGVCALFVRSPRRAGGLLALCALRLRRSTRVRFAASRPCARLRFGPSRVCPLRRCRWGVWVGVPSRPCRPLPAGASAAPCGGGGWWLSSFAVGFCGGVSWLVRWLFLPLRAWFCPLVVVLRPGRVPRWASRSARRRWRCWALSRSRGFRRRSRRPRSRARGVGACRPLVVAVGFAPCRLARVARPRGRFPCRFRRRPFRLAVAARRAPWPPCSRLVAGLSRVGVFGGVRGGFARRVLCAARAGFARRAPPRAAPAGSGCACWRVGRAGRVGWWRWRCRSFRARARFRAGWARLSLARPRRCRACRCRSARVAVARVAVARRAPRSAPARRRCRCFSFPSLCLPACAGLFFAREIIKNDSSCYHFIKTTAIIHCNNTIFQTEEARK